MRIYSFWQKNNLLEIINIMGYVLKNLVYILGVLLWEIFP